jgi:SOS response regulatory protein OraA/RecX
MKILGAAYAIFILNKTDRSQRELFKRLRALELSHAVNHRRVPGGANDEDF